MVIEEIIKRRSIREYCSKPVEKEKLERIMEAGRLAPTAKNNQDWKIIIVDNTEIKNKLINAASPHQPFLKEAPIILAACGLNPEYRMRCGHPSYLIDLSIVLDHIALQAVKEGLGTCWIGSFYEDKAKEVLNIPKNIKIVELMSLGYPQEAPSPRLRKPVGELYIWNKW